MKKMVKSLIAAIGVALMMTGSMFAAEELPTKGYKITIYNADGTEGMPIDGTKSVSPFCLRTAIEDARVFVNNAFLFGIKPPATYVVEMYENSTEDKSFEIGSDVTINGNGYKIVCAEGVTVKDNGTLNNATIEVPVTSVAKIGDASYATFAEALNAAKAGDIVEIVASELVFDENAASIVIEKAITIKGAGADNTKLKFNSATSAFTVSSSNVTFKDLTIEQGVKDNSFHISISKGAWDAPAIQYQNILIENVKFAGSDYALCLIGENVVVKGCTFTDQDSHNIIIYSLKGESKIIDNTFNASKGNNKSAVLWEGGADNATDLTQFVGSGELVISGNIAISKGVFFQFTNWGLVKNVSVEISGNKIDAFTNKAIAIYDMDGAVKAKGDEFGTFEVKNNVFTNVPEGRPILKEYTGTVEVDASENYLGSGEPVIDSLIVGEKVVVDSYYSDSELKTLVNCSAPAVTTGAELIDALEAGGNVKLGADIALKASDSNIEDNYYAYVLLNNDVTLDLNGYTLSCAVNPNWDDDYYYVCIGGSAELIITDSVGTGKILAREQHISFESLYMDDVWTDVPSITVQGGTVNSIALSDGATFGVTGGNATVYLHDEDYYYSYDEYKDYLESLTFTTDPTAYLPEGFNVVENADGTFGFEEIPAVIAVAKIGDTPYTTLEAALNAAKAGDTVEIVVAGNYELKNNYVEEGAYRLPDNFTLKGMVDGVVVTNGPTIRANNLTIDNVDFNNPIQKNYQSGLVFYLTGDSVIKNSDIYGYWGASYYSVVTGTLLVDNCTFDTQVYGLHIAEGNADVTVKNSVVAGWNTYGSDIRVTFTGCTFKDNRGYHYLGFYGDAVIEDCKFEENVTIGSQTADAIVIDISNSKVVDDNGDEIAEKSICDIIEQETLDSDVVVKIDNIHVNGKVAKIGETTYATLADALAAAQTGDTVELLSNVVVGSYETNKFENVNFTAVNGAEMTIEANGEVRFIGSDLTNVKIIGAGTTRFYNTVNFYGANNVLSVINGTPFDLIVNKQSTLLISRFVLGYNRNITVYGDIEDASALTASDITGMTPSLKFNSTSGVSVGGTDVGNLIVKDAYIELGNSSWKNAYGTYDWNFTNSYVSATSLFNAAAGATSAAKWNVTFDDCVLSAKNYIKNGVGVTINFYNGSVATTGSMRIDGELNIDKTSSVSTTLQQNNVVGKVDEHGGINGTVNVEGVLTIGSNARTQLEVLGGKINVKGGTLNLGSNTLTLDSASEMTSSGDVTGAIVVADGALVSLTGGTYVQDVADYCAEGYLCAEQNSDPVLWKVGRLPSAEVVNLGPVEVGPDGDYTFGDSYYVYDLVGTHKMTTSNETFDLQIALNFIAKDTVAQAEKNAFGNYTTDFYITIDGIADGSFVADEDCYLAGYYPSFNAWVKIPLTGFKIEAGKVYPVITSAGFDFKYTDICGSVGDFICGIHLSDAVLQANPALKVKLELGLSKTYDDALAADKFVGVDQPYEYDVEDMTSAVAVTGPDYYTTVTGAVEVAVQTGDFVKLVVNADLDDNLTLASDLVFNLGGNKLTANGKTLAIKDSAVAITNGTLSAFTKDNVTLTGNAILTVTDKDVADSFRAETTYYVSQNKNGTYSIMLKSAFRVFITVVDGEPRIGFFKDCSALAPVYTLLGATSLENADWTPIAYVEADDASGASELPLYWSKLDQDADDANVYRFFKIGPVPAAE